MSVYVFNSSISRQYVLILLKKRQNGGSNSCQIKPYPAYLGLRRALDSLVRLFEAKKR